MTKYELEKRFKELSLERYNQDKTEKVEMNDRWFQTYLEGILISMISKEEFESWIEYLEKKIGE